MMIILQDKKEKESDNKYGMIVIFLEVLKK